MKFLPIIHVYGQLGKPHFSDPEGRDYTTQITELDIRKSMEGINFIHDEADLSATLATVHALIHESKLLCFFGFGFHRKNVERLGLKKLSVHSHVHMTTYGREKGEIFRDRKLLTDNGAIYGNNIHEHDCTVHQFIRKTDELV